MKNLATNSLRYTGIVTISRYNGSKKIKLVEKQNSGKYALFNFFSDCLLGDFSIAKFNWPSKIMLLEYIDNNSQGGQPHYESRSGFIYLLNKPEKVYSPSKSSVRFSFLVPRDLLEGTTFNSIGLYADSASTLEYENFAALVTDVRLSSQSLATSSALLIDWELNISNREKETI